MERKKQRSLVSGQYYNEKDFLIGRTVSLGGFKFMLTSSDEYTEKYMQDNGDVFPEASFKTIINKIKAPAKNYPDLQSYAIDLLKMFDKNNNKLIDFDEFTTGLRNMNINITNHEQHALMKIFDHNGDGQISMEEFYNTLALEF
jgi:Ca2+-binding EF-hand superfamily protein